MTTEQPTFEDLFKNIIDQAKSKYIGHREKKGDSWQTCDIEYLEKRLVEEVKEFTDATLAEAKFKEILDVINFSLMLGERWFKEFYEVWRRTPVR